LCHCIVLQASGNQFPGIDHCCEFDTSDNAGVASG
jgi:hypothetical protein